MPFCIIRMISIENFTSSPKANCFGRSFHCTTYKNKQNQSRKCYSSSEVAHIHMKMSKVFQFVVFALGLVCMAGCQPSGTDVKLREGKIGFLGGATTMLSSLAQDLLSRSAANSQVLSLNITNLFILLVLKAIIFGAGAFGYGHGGYARTADGLLKENIAKNFNFDEFLSESELLLMLGYLKAESTHKFECLQRSACEDPRKAKEYLLTGKIIVKGSQIFTQSLNTSKYENTFAHLEEAISYGLKGEDCSAKYQCEGS